MKRMIALAVAGTAVLCAVAYGTRGSDGGQLAGLQLPQSVRQGLQGMNGAQVALGHAFIEGGGAATSTVVGNGGSIVLGAGYRMRASTTTPALDIRLQRRTSSGGWTTTAADVAVDADGGLRVHTPPYSTGRATAPVDYRLVADPASGGSASTPIRVVYENQRFYSGVAATIYEEAAEYCPTTAVHVTDLAEEHAGDFQTGGLLIRIAPDVGRTVNTRPIDLRAVALHECSHERQWVDYGGTIAGRETMKADAARLFADVEKPADVVTPYEYEPPAGAIDPVEHAADCGAQAMNPGGYLGYGGYCTPNELAEGRRLLLGLRY